MNIFKRWLILAVIRILFCVIMAIWLFPAIIALIEHDFLLIFLYLVWWIPASILTTVIGAPLASLIDKI